MNSTLLTSWSTSWFKMASSSSTFPLIWRDKFFKDAYFGSDFMLIGITDPKLFEWNHLGFSGNAKWYQITLFWRRTIQGSSLSFWREGLSLIQKYFINWRWYQRINLYLWDPTFWINISGYFFAKCSLALNVNSCITIKKKTIWNRCYVDFDAISWAAKLEQAFGRSHSLYPMFRGRSSLLILTQKWVSGVPYIKNRTWEINEMCIKLRHFGPLDMWNGKNYGDESDLFFNCGKSNSA